MRLRSFIVSGVTLGLGLLVGWLIGSGRIGYALVIAFAISLYGLLVFVPLELIREWRRGNL